VTQYWANREEIFKRNCRKLPTKDTVVVRVTWKGAPPEQVAGSTPIDPRRALYNDEITDEAIENMISLQQFWERMSKRPRYVTVARAFNEKGQLTVTELLGCSCQSTIWAGRALPRHLPLMKHDINLLLVCACCMKDYHADIFWQAGDSKNLIIASNGKISWCL